MGAKNWTIEEKEYLEDNWGLKSVPTIAKNLNRSIDAVVVMKNRIGLGSFLDSGEYITFNQLKLALNINGGSGYKNISWVKNRNFPIKTKKVLNNSFQVVYLEDFWKWAEQYQTFIDWFKVEKNILGKEPEWVDQQRKISYKTKRIIKMTPWTNIEDEYLKSLISEYKYSYKEIAEKLSRTEGAIIRRCQDLNIKGRPIKADNHIKWTYEELIKLRELLLNRTSYELMSKEIGRGTKAIRGTVYRLYGTENIDKAARMLGNSLS